jgi:carbonic anhydrase
MDAAMQTLVAAMRAQRDRHAAAQDFYRTLSTGQSPGVVVICCSDSRAAPEHIARADPGALFVERSVAGLVPPPPGAAERAWLRAYGAVTRTFGMRQLAGAWYGAWAAIEYPVMHLQVANILVLGHSGCGGIALACRPRGEQASLHDTDCWVDMVRPALRPVLRRHPDGHGARAAEETAILWSRANLLRHTGIANRVRDGLTTVHAAHYDIASGEVAFYDADRGSFAALSGEGSADARAAAGG